MITWVISVVGAIVLLAILIGMCFSDNFLEFIGIILSLGMILIALTLTMHLLFFE